MDFQSLVNELSHKEFNKNSIYSLLSRIDESYDLSKVLPKIYSLVEKKILEKDLVYLNLLASSNLKIVQEFIDYEKDNFQVDISTPSSIFDYCFFKSKHWLLEVINGDLNLNKTKLPKDVLNYFNILNLIKISNEADIDIDRINTKLQCIDTSVENSFLRFYFTELKRVLNVIVFCKNFGSVDDNHVYTFTSENSLLQTFSKFLNLNSIEVCEEVLLFLRSNESDNVVTYEEANVLAAYVLFLKVIKCMELCKSINEGNPMKDKDEISEMVQEIRNGIVAINNRALLIEMLENIFVLLFLQEDAVFYCTEREVRLILTLLKSLHDELSLKNVFERDSSEYRRFGELGKHISDGLWRLELVCNQNRKIQQNIVSYMLAPPDPLIYLCLKQKDFNKARQVISIFDLKGPVLTEIQNHEKVCRLQEMIKQNFAKNEARVVTPRIACEEFISSCDTTDKYTEYPFLNTKLIDVVDIILTQKSKYSDTLELLTLVNGCNIPFLEDLAKIFMEVNSTESCTIPEILCNPMIDLTVEKYIEKEQLYADLVHYFELFNRENVTGTLGTLNQNHSAHKLFLNLQETCLKFQNRNEDVFKYMQRLLNYLKAYSQLLYVGNNHTALVSSGKNCSYFRLLDFSTSEILAPLLFEKKIDVSDFESVFARLKLDLVYHLASIFFPTIILNSPVHKRTDFIHLRNKYKPTTEILAYIRKRNWLLAFILNEIFKVEREEMNETRTTLFKNYVKLNRIQNLKVVFGGNDVTCGLQHEMNVDIFNPFINQFLQTSEEVEKQITVDSVASDVSLETGTEIFEGDLKTTNWKHLFDVIDSVPQNMLIENPTLSELRDTILTNLAGENFDPEDFRYVQYVRNRTTRCNCILNNFTTWPGCFCIDVLKSELSNFDGVVDEFKMKFQSWLPKIQLYENIRTIIDSTSWFDIYLMCQNSPEEVLQRLLNTVEVDLLLDLINTHELQPDLLAIIDANYFVTLLESNVSLSKISELLSKMHPTHVEPICFQSLKMLKKVEYLQFIVEVLHQFGESVFLKNIKLSVKILSTFEPSEQEHFWCLIGDPLSIIEVLIMNTKLEKLGLVLKEITSDITNCEFAGEDREVTLEKIDALLQTYAEKSLEFRVVLQPPPRIIRTPESGKLLQSLDSLQLIPSLKTFIMPIDVPDKVDWVQNDEVTECMCCQQTTFSMFNRRHHCRRCGRVVCANCSIKRMKVPTYGDILVRVCSDCFEQSQQEGTSSSFKSESIKQISHDFWFLTDDPHHNFIVRDEFSYEHAPSVSLCLAILKYHSKTEAYPRFLLNQCEGMLKLLRLPNPSGLQEIDYSLVIQMLQSLAVAAKVISAQCMLHWGTALADRMLSQSDILGLLAGRGCLELIPPPSQDQSHFIDAASLRRLRDKLLENEQWHLALEVSTKAGLDNTGVFVAWGKSCLKAGSLQAAREKFQRCFDKVHETSLDLSGSHGSSVRFLRSKSVSSDIKSMKNPPLLDDIIQILESNKMIIDPKILKEVKSVKPLSASTWSLSSSVSSVVQSDTAICVLNKLRNLDKIMAGNYSSLVESLSNKSLLANKESKIQLDRLFYDECIFYLKKYGSHMSLLEFYVRHKQFDGVVTHIAEHRLSNEIFVEVYNLCLKKDQITSFHEAMSKMDSTLDMWKDYLKYICRTFEEQSKLHCLYQLQQFMGDFVRAAMTCIKFYKEGVKTFSELASRVGFLHKAQEHLRQELEQEQWIEVATVQSTNSHESFEAKAITNPSLVMKLDAKNINRHINTISRQTEITMYLASCESNGTNIIEILGDILPPDDEEVHLQNRLKLPTLFGSNQEKTQLSILAIASGDNVDKGFEIAFRAIRDYQLNPLKVYCQAGNQLAKREKYSSIAQLVSCIKSSGLSSSAVADMCDEMLMLSVQTLTKANKIGPEIDGLIKLISDRNLKISAYIEAKQLKSAYLLAVKHKKIGDIRRILREAEFLNQPNIKILCQKVLQTHSHSPSRS